MSKKRTLGDEFRDYKAGKISGNHYHNGINNSDVYYQPTSASRTLGNGSGKITVSYNDWLEHQAELNSTKLIKTNQNYDTKNYNTKPTKSNQKDNAKNKILNSVSSIANTVANSISENVSNYNAQTIKELTKNRKKLQDERDNYALSSGIEDPRRDIVYREYDSKIQKLDNQIAKKQRHGEYDLSDKQKAVLANIGEKANKLTESFENKYKYSTLKQRQDARIHATTSELNWLNKHMYDNATNEELENYNKQLNKEAESLWSKRDEEQAYNRLKAIEDEQEKLKTAIDNAKLNKRKKAEYNDVVDNDIKAKTVLQNYYALQEYLKTNGSDADEATNTDNSYIGKMSVSERNKIKSDFEHLKDKGYDTDSLYKWYEREQEETKAQDNLERIKAYAKDYPAIASINSVGQRLVGAVPDALKYISNELNKKYNGGDGYINPATTETAKSDTIRQAVSEKINNDFGSFLYNTGMSIADFTTLLPLNAVPGGQALSLGIMGTSAGVGAANEVIENGGTIDNAVKTGFAAGIAETLFEKVSLEQLSVFKASGKSTMRAAIGNVLKGAFTEGSEEAFTDLANRLTDDAINGDLSSYNRSKQRYIEQGMSEAEAEKAASWDFWNNVALDFAGGAVSGGVLNFVTAGINLGGVKLDLAKNKESNLADGKAALADENFDLNLLIKQGLATEKNDRAYNLAKKMEKAFEDGGKENIEAADVGNLRFLIGREISRNPELINRIAEVTKAETEKTQSSQTVNQNNQNTVQNMQEVPQNEQGSTQPSQANSVVDTTKKADTESVSRQYGAYAFGKKHPNGITATDVSTGKAVKIAIKNLESSSKVNLNDEENTLVFNTTDGKQVNADSITFSSKKLDTIVHSANEFDTYGARNYISNFEEWSESPLAQKMSEDEQLYKYNNAYSAAYNYGREGVKFGTLKQTESSKYRILNNILGENIIKQAMSAGRRDVNITTQHHANRLTELINRNGRADTSGVTVYADNGTDVSHIPHELINTLGNLAIKTGRNIIISDRLADGVNGVAKDGNIYLSSEITSQKILATALHEAGHTIKKTNPTEWQTLSSFVSDYLVRRGIDIDKMIDRTIERYDNRLTSDEGENTRDAALEEIVCDTLMSLASDEKALNIALSTRQNKSKIAAAIKSLINKVKEWLTGKSTNYGAKAFAKDIEALEQLAERFSEAADTARENITEQTEVQNGEKLYVEKFSIEYTDDNKPVVVITDNILKGVPKKDWIPTVKKTISNKFKNGIPVKGRLIKVNKDTGNEYTNSRYTQRIRSTNSTVYKNKLKSANNLDEIIISSTNYINEALNHPRKDNIKQFARGNVLMEIGNNQYSAEVIIGFTSGNNMLLYDLINLKSTSFTIKKTDASTAQQKTNSEDSRLNASATNMISQNSKNVNEKFSLDEEDRDLVAAHNISSQNLMNLINDFNGEGLPVPSIAIEKADNLHDDFGDITLLFDKDTIDPEADSRNKVYNRDAWTSTFPETEMKINKVSLNKLADRLGMSGYVLEQNAFDNVKNLEKAKEKLGRLRETKNAFIKEKGIKVAPKDVEREPSSKLFYRIKFKKFIRQNNITFDDLVYNQKLRDDLLATVLNVPSVLEETQKAADDFNQILDDCKKSKDAYNKYKEQMEYNIKYAKGKTQKVKGSNITDSDIDEAVDEHRNEYDAYVDSLVSNDLLEGKYIIDEDVDIYNEDDSRKSWDDTHLEYNIDNVVKAMKIGASSVGDSVSGGAIYTSTFSTQEFGSIDEIRRNKENIKVLSEEEQSENQQKISDILSPVIYEVSNSRQSDSSYNGMDDFFTASDNIVDAFKESKTKNGVYNYLKQYYPALKKSTVDKLFAARDEIANMPTRYFEAKPHRAVGFDEVMAAVIPTDADESLKKALKGMNIPLYEYADESQRADAARKAINTEYTDKAGTIHDTLKFSIDEEYDDLFDFDYADDKHIDFEKAVDESYPELTIEQIYHHAARNVKEGLLAGKGIKPETKKIYNMVKSVMRSYHINTNAETESLVTDYVDALNTFIDSVQNDKSSFTDAFESFVMQCRESLTYSTQLDEQHEAWAEEIRKELYGTTLLIPDSAVDTIKENYGSVGKYRKALFGKINVKLERSARGITGSAKGAYIEDIGSHLEEIGGRSLMIEDGFEWDSDSGYRMLDRIINYVLAPQYVSTYGGQIQSESTIDAAAIQMAFDTTAEYLKQQGKAAVRQNNIDKKKLRDLNKTLKQAQKAKNALHKKTVENYREDFAKQQEKIKQLRADKKELNEQNARLTAIVNTERKTVAEEYRAERDKTKYRQIINTTLERLINRHLKPKPNKNVPISVVQPLYNLLSELTGNYEGFSKGVNDLTEKTGYNNTVDENGERKNTVTLSRETEQLIKAINHEISATDGKITLPPALRNALMGYDVTDDKGHSKTHFTGLLEDVKGVFENAEKRGKTSLKDFSLDELERISKALIQVKNMLDKANKVVINGKEYDTYLISRKGVEELQKIQGTKKRGSVNEASGIKRVLELYRNHMADPIRFARMITGYHNDSVLVQMMEMLNQGQSDAETLSIEWTKKIENELNRFDYKSKKDYVREKAMEFESIDPNTKMPLIDPKTGEGVKVGLTADMLVEMLLEYEDEYGKAHMMYSGYQVPNIKYIKRKNQQLMYSKDSGCYILPTEETIAQIKGYVMHNDICRTVYELCHDMYNNDMQVAVNQVSTEKYGYEIAKVKNYCPITIDDDTVYGTYADVLINRSINSRAFLHEREKFKYNRLKLKGAIGKLQSQIDSVSSWCGLTMPIENFNRVYNMTRFEHEDDDLIRNVQNENLIAAESVRQKNNTYEGEKVKLSIDEHFTEKYDKWNKKGGRFSFRVGSTSDVLQKLGVDNKNIWWDTSKILKIKNKHPEMTDDILKQVPDILESPIIVMESYTVKGRLVVFGDVYDAKNNPVLVALELNPIGEGGKSLDIIKIASAYGKDSNLQHMIDKSNILYVDPNEKRTHTWLTGNGLQLPLPSSKYGFSDNIKSQNYGDVKYSVNETFLTSQQKSKTEYFPSMKEIMKQQWGDESGKYISKLMGDLQGSTKQIDPGRIDMLTGKYIRAVLTANISSAIKQLSSYPLAAARVGWRATIAGLKHIRPGKHTPFLNRALPDSYKHNVPYDEIAKYTPILEYRKQGNNSREMAEISKYKGLIDSSGVIGHTLDRLNWIEKMDVNLVDMNYWIAYEHVKGDLKISPDSKEFMPTVAKTLEDIINNMMPNSSIMQQGQILRSKNPINRVWTICKSQVFCMVNAAMDASGEYNARLQDYKAAVGDFKKEQARTEFKVAQKKLARTYSAILVSTVMTCGMLMPLIAAAFGKWDRYRDEDGNITPWSIGLRMLKDLGSEMSGMFLYGDTVYNAVLSIIDQNEDYYGISLPGVDTVNDFVNGIINISRSDSREKLMKNISSLIGTLGMMTGLPTKNLMNLWQGASNHFTNFTKYGGTPTVNDHGEITMQMYANYCYDALIDGDKKKYAKLYSEWLKEKTSSGKQVDKSYINSKLKTELEDDKEIITAGNAFFSGDLTTYENTVEKYAGLGFNKTTVVNAINSIVNDLEEEQKGSEGLDKYESEKSSDKEPELYSYSDAFDFLKNGNTGSYEKVEKYLMERKDKSKSQIKALMRSTSRTGPIFEQYIRASKSNDAGATHTLYKQLLNIYGSDSEFKVALRKYQDKVKKQKRK